MLQFYKYKHMKNLYIYCMEEIFVNRSGLSKNSNMTTSNLVNIFNSNDRVIFNNGIIKKIEKKNPAYIKISGKVIDNNYNITKNNNILGNNSFLIINESKVYIPIQISTKEKLDFYNCKLIKENDEFIINSNYDVGLFEMDIGKNYLKDYLLKKDFGNGFYIEYHDQPYYYKFLKNR